LKGGIKTRTKFLFDSIDKSRQDKLIEIAKKLKPNERGVNILYVASKLKDNKENRKFIEKFINSIKKTKDFDISRAGEELKRACGVLEKNYGKNFIKNSINGREIVSALYGFEKEITIKRGINEVWNDYLIRIKGIEDKEKRDKKIKEYEGAKAFLEKRGFLEYILDARNGIQIYHSLRLMENNAGLIITRENYNIADLGIKEDMIKGELADNGLAELGECLKQNNLISDNWNRVRDLIKKRDVMKDITDTELEEFSYRLDIQNDFSNNGKLREGFIPAKQESEFKPEIPKPAKNDYGEFGLMNSGNKKLSKIYYDIETNAKQEPCLVGVYNKDLKRIVIAQVKKELGLAPKFKKYYKNGFEIIKCEVANGYEPLFLADAETYLACVCNSLMRQGDKTPSILAGMIEDVDINYKRFLEVYNNKRRSLWIAHNSNFDINKLNLTAKNGLRHIDSSGVKVEDIVINTFGNKKRYLGYMYDANKESDSEKWSVSHKLGNRNIGVYFKASTRKYGLYEKPEIELKPIQKESDNYVYGLDSLLIAKALQKDSASLKALSNEYDLEVKKGESAYNFNGSELWSDKESDIKEIEYLIKDLFVTDYVFRELCKEIDVIPDLLSLINVDKKRIKKHAAEVPYLYRVYSTASLSKLFYQMKYSEDYDEWKVKHGNSKFYENINDIFKEVYSGGRVEIFKHGIISDKKIVYSDFASLYPHTSYLTDIEPLMNDILNKKLNFTSDVEIIETKFWGMIGGLVRKIKNKEMFEKSDFINSSVLNVTLKGVDLRLSRKASIFRGEVKTDANKRSRCDLIINSDSVVNVGVYDLCYSVLEKILIDKFKLEDLQKKIIFNKGLMVIPSVKTDKTNDMHTNLYERRGAIKKEISAETNEDKRKHLESQSQFIKIILNAGYGITAEFNNDRAGQFYNPILASSITGMARLLNNLTEISTRYYGYNCYYSDTDSLFLDSGGYNIVSKLFENICELKNELPAGIFVKDMIIVGAKEYAYFTNDKKNYAVKTHGVGYRARGYKDVLEKLFRDMISGFNKETAIKNAVINAPLLRNFNFTHIYGRTNTLYTNLSSMVNKNSDVLGEYKIGDSVFRCYSYGKTGLFITDCENITKGTFGLMFRLSEPKIYFFSVKYGFNESMLKEILENIGGIPNEKRAVILDRLEKKYSESLFLEKYLDKNEDNVKRKILENGVCVPFNTAINEDIDISFNEKELLLDGVEFCGMVDLPKFDFASKMQADLTTYYSKSITSLSKSLSYWFANRQNPDSAADVFNKRNSELLIPQKKNEIIIPLNMVEVPESEAQFKMMLEAKEKKKVLDKYFKKSETGGYYALKNKVNFSDIKNELLTELKPRNTILSEYFNKKKYWFEVTSYKANKHNAILRVNVVVGNPPKLKYYLWINPTPFFNVKLWKASYTDLMFSCEGLSELVNKVFEIGYNNSEGMHGVVYNSILSSFSRGSSYSLQDLKKNNKYFLDICYAVACSFIIKNSVKHSSLKIGRLDLSCNIEKNVSEDKQDLVISFLQKQLNREVNDFLDVKAKKDFVERTRLSEDVYTAGGGHYSGLVNKRTKISQVIYNKSKQLDYKLIKASRKKNMSALTLQRLSECKDNFNGVWRLEVQAYGYKAIQKAVTSYDKIIKKMSKLLLIVIRLVNKINLREFVVLKEFNAENKAFSIWFNDITRERYKPPLLMVKT